MMNSSSPSSAFVCKRIGPGLLAPGMQAARRAPPFERVSHSWNKDGVGRVAGDPRERVDRYGGKARKRGTRTETARRNMDAGAGGEKASFPFLPYLALCVCLLKIVGQQPGCPRVWIELDSKLLTC